LLFDFWLTAQKSWVLEEYIGKYCLNPNKPAPIQKKEGDQKTDIKIKIFGCRKVCVLLPWVLCAFAKSLIEFLK
jgi:hypothetical protein